MFLTLSQDDIRVLVSSLIDPENPDIRIADKKAVDRFEKTQKARDGPDLDDIYFDFSGSSPFTLWNQRIALLLAKRYVEEEGALVTDVQEVQKACVNRLRKLHAKHHESLVTLTAEEQDEKEDKKRAASRKGRQYSVGHPSLCTLFSIRLFILAT